MQRARLALLATLAFSLLTGCDTSCGKRGEPVLWADGIRAPDVAGRPSYQTTPIDSTWLHFPSYRRFRLPHGLGTKNLDIVTYVSLAEDTPVQNESESTRFEVASSGEVLAVIEDENTVLIENSTCENAYYLFARISDATASPSGAAAP